MKFKEWFKNKLLETSTSTACIANFARIIGGSDDIKKRKFPKTITENNKKITY